MQVDDNVEVERRPDLERIIECPEDRLCDAPVDVAGLPERPAFLQHFGHVLATYTKIVWSTLSSSWQAVLEHYGNIGRLSADSCFRVDMRSRAAGVDDAIGFAIDFDLASFIPHRPVDHAVYDRRRAWLHNQVACHHAVQVQRAVGLNGRLNCNHPVHAHIAIDDEGAFDLVPYNLQGVLLQ